MSTLNKIKEEAAIDYAEKRFTNIDDQIKAAEAFAMGFELAQDVVPASLAKLTNKND